MNRIFRKYFNKIYAFTAKIAKSGDIPLRVARILFTEVDNAILSAQLPIVFGQLHCQLTNRIFSTINHPLMYPKITNWKELRHLAKMKKGDTVALIRSSHGRIFDGYEGTVQDVAKDGSFYRVQHQHLCAQ